MDYVIKVRNVTKKFKEATALKDVTVSFERGKIYGIIGRNGSGKTVLFKCVCGLLAVSEGEITVLGQTIGDGLRVPKGVGAVIETPGFLPNASGYRNLFYLASLSGKPDRQKIRDVIAMVGLDPDSRKHVGKYSMGMRQRLGLAQAIMDDPELLILDEPMNGLDNQGTKQMRQLLIDFRSQGKTIILASHSQEDISTLCDVVYQMDAGVLTLQNTQEN
ncbi:MAG: ABC transporter ATP-binding protein [Faecousia sp.]